MWLQEFASSKKVYHTILCSLTVSNIVIILVQSSIADGESFLVIFHVFLYLSEIILASLAIKNFLNQLSTLYKQQIQI